MSASRLGFSIWPKWRPIPVWRSSMMRPPTPADGIVPPELLVWAKKLRGTVWCRRARGKGLPDLYRGADGECRAPGLSRGAGGCPGGHNIASRGVKR